MSRLFNASVVENKFLTKNHYRLSLRPAIKINRPKPGNFFMLSVDSSLDPLLKRPFSVHGWNRGAFQILYRVVGKGTELLSRKMTGSVLEVLGPLGNAFPISKETQQIILIAGGLGIAPIYFLAESLKNKAPLLFYGTRTKSEILLSSDFRSLGIKPVVTTDDGSRGMKGNVVSFLKRFFNDKPGSTDKTLLYACGPEPMLKALSVLASRLNIKGYFALEQNMACGIGTCLGCVVNTKNGYQRVCKEGPVFPIDDVVF